jgi:chromosome segregation protein
LLKLKKLQILGFKSFCDRTELRFHGDGIAAVVGPNGCGKSNIADAISWVLGEQSAKSLRGTQMMDVIFAGTRDRKPTGMAEVTLTLVDPEVYDGELSPSPELDIQNDLSAAEDWDEQALRAVAAAATEEHIQENQPGAILDENGTPLATASGDAPAAGPDPAPAAAAAAPGNDVVLKIRRRRFNAQKYHKGEIVVTRRLFRSGTSEYLLNGKLCRLRDIQDLFMGTGLGPESYAIIEQGRIGQILSSKPHDRRAMIEEAAGITMFKTRKRLAELRLEASKQNLARINDIFDEVTRQMNSLKRQASKAERYARLREEMREKLRLVLASRFDQVAAALHQAGEDVCAIAAEIDSRSTAVAAMESAHAQDQQRGYDLEQQSAAARERISSIQLAADRAAQRRQTNVERCAELLARSAAAQGELARAQDQLASLTQERDADRATLDSALADLAAAREDALLRQQGSAAAAAAVIETERTQETGRALLLEVMAAAHQVRNQMAQAEEHLASLDRDSARVERDRAAALAEIDAIGGRRGQLGLSFESETQRVQALQDRIAGVRAGILATREQESAAKRRLDGLRAEFASALGRRGSLEALIAEHGYSTESVKRLFQSGALAGGRAPVGVLADFLAVDDKYESVVEDFLRDELNFVVVKSWDAVDEGLRLLRSEVDGRATFLVHPSDSQARFSFTVNENTRHSLPNAPVVRLKDCIRVLNGFGQSLEVILPKLRDGYITQDAATARDLALSNPDAFFLSPSGETFHNVTVTGGKQRKEGPLSLKRELRDLSQTVHDLEAAIRAEESRILAFTRDLGEMESLLARLEAELREAEKQALTHGHALEQMAADVARIQSRLDALLSEAGRLRSGREDRSAFLEARRAELASHLARHAALEQQVAASHEALAQQRAARDAAAQAAAASAVRLAAIEERHRSAEANLQRIESLFAELTHRMADLEGQIASASAERTQREQENLEIDASLEQLAQERLAAESAAASLQAEAAALRARLLEQEASLRQSRLELDACRDRRGEWQAVQAKLQSDLAHLEETCLKELNQSAEDLRSDLTLLRVQGDHLASEEAACQEMRARLDSMGPVNMMALEEYKETAQRHEFLETQRKDLIDSIENTQSSIREIDAICRSKFEEAFHKVNENFQQTFAKLFGGGQGFMRLTDIENSNDCGIDIVASPPGKKLQNVLLLSGGEKALTAIALLVAIFQYTPSPFCILDEVDAPLDESNVGRFADLVREMSASTQFVLITHSKRTMQAAPVLYGVTMQEPGVSKVVSVRFNEDRAPQPQAAIA